MSPYQTRLRVCKFCGTDSDKTPFHKTHSNRCKPCYNYERKVSRPLKREPVKSGFTAASKDRSLLAKRRSVAIDKGRKYARAVD